MSDELVLYYNPQSRARMAHWMLEEVGAPYRIELVRFDKREHKTDRYLALNPMGKLPTLVHRGTVVTEASAIFAYLADSFPQAGLAPPVDSPQRGTYYRWLFFAASTLEYAAFDKSANRTSDTPGRIGYGTYEDTLGALEKAVTPGPYILGDKFSAADIYVGSQIGWGLMTKSIEARPAFVAYSGRLMSRPSFARVNEQGAKYSEQLKS
jgi:glutathione S-transferase